MNIHTIRAMCTSQKTSNVLNIIAWTAIALIAIIMIAGLIQAGTTESFIAAHNH